ncbi:MAG: GTPase [Nonlabens sp.]
MARRLIFVYNANSGKLNAWLDSAHKIVSPKTYQCRLCDLTYDIFKENEDWARFRESVITSNPNLLLEFLHIDEFEKKYWSKWLPKYEYPIILEKSEEEQDYNDGFGTNSGLDVFMSNQEIKQIESTSQFIDNFKRKIV